MRLFAGTSQQFIQDTIQNQIAEKLRLAFFNYFRYYPSPSEINSWRNSLRAVSQVFQYADLTDQGIILEYQLPLTSKRLDCLICGRDATTKDNAVIIELKQWDKCETASGENEVITWVGGKREMLHPSIQVGQYKMYLEDTHTAFHADANPVILNACTYLHNYNYYSDDVLLSEKFKIALENYPLFTADDVNRLKNYLTAKLERGDGIDVLKRIEESKYRPSKKLMDHVGNIIKGKSEYVLLDEQQIVYDKVLSCAKEGFHDKQKTVIGLLDIRTHDLLPMHTIIAIDAKSEIGLLNVEYYVYGTDSQSWISLRISKKNAPHLFEKYWKSYEYVHNRSRDIEANN
ncbi:MAG: hypothetical protein ABSD92_01425 [Candidatus Bathyarchaeia archaeon]|jgi:hypothetical protein